MSEPTWKKQGFKSRRAYDEHLAIKKGFKSHAEYRQYLAKQKGFKSNAEYQIYLARKKGFKSTAEYQKHLAKKKLCRSLQKIVSEVSEPRSIFTDIDFLNDYTGCKITAKKKKRIVHQNQEEI